MEILPSQLLEAPAMSPSAKKDWLLHFDLFYDRHDIVVEGMAVRRGGRGQCMPNFLMA
jgi:hypothetical protein